MKLFASPLDKLERKVEKTASRLERFVLRMGEALKEEAVSYLRSFGDTPLLLKKRSHRSFHVAQMLFNTVNATQTNDTEGSLDRRLYDWLYSEVERLIPRGEFKDDSMRANQYVLRGFACYQRVRLEDQERQEGRGNDKLYLKYLFKIKDNLENAVLEEKDDIKVFWVLGNVYNMLAYAVGTKTEQGKEFANQAVKQHMKARTRGDDGEYVTISVCLSDAYLLLDERYLAIKALDEAARKTDDNTILRRICLRKADICKKLYQERTYDMGLKEALDNILRSAESLGVSPAEINRFRV